MHEEEDDDNWMAALMDGCMDVFILCFSGYVLLGPPQQLWLWPGMALRASACTAAPQIGLNI